MASPLLERLRGLVRGGETDVFRPDASRDVFLASYPRSGNTWLRTICAMLLYGGDPEDLASLDALVPDEHALPRRREVPDREFWVVKTHAPWCAKGTAGGRYRRAIYVLRHPWDVLLSYHRWHRHLADSCGSLEEFAEQWLAGEIWPGRWDDHVRSWLRDGAADPGLAIHLVRFEETLANPVAAVDGVAAFLGVDANEARISEIVDRTTADRMREREARGNRPGLKRRGFEFVGGARAGAWRDAMPPDLARRLADRLPLAEEMGYALA